MKKLIFYFVVLLVSVWIGIKIHANPGYVLISYQNWSVETSLWFATLALILFLFILYVLYRTLHSMYNMTGRWHRWADWRRIRKARKLTSRGLCELAEGDWKRAEKYLTRAADHSEMPLINYLAAARAAQGQEAYERRDNYLRKAHDTTAGSEEMAVGLTQAQLQLSSRQLERALATLRHLNQLVPHHAYVLKLLQGVYQELRDWEGLRELLPELRKYKVLSEKELDQLEERVYIELLRQAARSNQPETLTSVWENTPRHFQKNPAVLSVYSDYLIKRGNDAQAEELLRDALKKTWSAELVHQYGTAQGKDPAKQFNSAESWLKAHPNDPALLLALGKICARNRLWGKARSYLEQSLKLEVNVETYQVLGKILEELGETQAALECYRAGLNVNNAYCPTSL